MARHAPPRFIPTVEGETYVLEGDESAVFVDVLDALVAHRATGRRVIRRSDGRAITYQATPQLRKSLVRWGLS